MDKCTTVNPDCLNCPFPECIRDLDDKYLTDEYIEHRHQIHKKYRDSDKGRAYIKAYRNDPKNIARHNELQRKYYANNYEQRQRRIERVKEYNEANKEKIREYHRLYYLRKKKENENRMERGS